MKKLISVALALVMLLSMSVVAFAAGEMITVYCQSPDGWETCHVHYWDSASGESSWPGVPMTKGENGIWSAEIPADAGGLLFNKQGDDGKTSDLTLPTDGKLQYVIGSGWAEPGDKVIVETKYYVTGNATLCGVEFTPDDANSVMTKGENDIWTKIYQDVAAGEYQLKITDGTWNNTWYDENPGADPGLDNYVLTLEAAADVKISFDAANGIVTVETGDFDETTETPDTDKPGTTDNEYYLVGYFNGADYDGTDYKFVDGKVTATFTVDSYVFVKKGDVSYMTNDWQGNEVTSVTLSDAATLAKGDKLFVPKDQALTFTLVVNADGTLTLSYATGTTTPGGNTSNEKYYVAGVGTLCGAEWKENDANNIMAKDDKGIWFKAYQNVAKGDYAIKVTDGTWTNSWGGEGKDGNYEFKVEADKATVVVKFDAAAKKVTVEVGGKVPTPAPGNTNKPNTNTGDNNGTTGNSGTNGEADKNLTGKLSAYRVVGNAAWMGQWNPASDAGRMLEVSPGVYKQNFDNVQPGNYELKITKDGTWDTSWGDNGNNFCFTIVKACTITVTFTLDGQVGKIAVKGSGVGDPGTGDYSMVSVMVLMSLAVCCAGILILNKKKFI